MLVVTVAATNRLLTTVDNVRLRGAVDDSIADDVITALIKSASAEVESFCCRVFARETVRETIRLGTGSLEQLVLQRRPVVSVSSFTEDGEALVLDTDYEIDLTTGQVYRLEDDDLSVFTGKLVITYVTGYVLPGDVGENLPADVEEVVIRRVGELQREQAAASTGATGAVKAEEIEGLGRIEYANASSSSSSTSRSSALGPDAERKLDTYRMIII